jgi:hypothetical protein
MTGPYPTQAEMHESHTEWRSEHAAWFDDLHTWRIQHAHAMAALSRLSADLQQHGATLLEHNRKIRAQSRGVKAHERELFTLQSAGLGDQADPELGEHTQRAEQQASVRTEHAELKKHHRQVLADLLKLVRELEGAEA